MKKQKLSTLVIKSFITTLENPSENKLMGGGRGEPTIASLPKTDCQPVPTTDIMWSGRC